MIPTRAAIDNTRWQDEAKCRFNRDFVTVSLDEQKQFCVGCPVINECLSFALDNEEKTVPNSPGWPVYGGMDQGQRLVLLKTRRRARAAARAATPIS